MNDCFHCLKPNADYKCMKCSEIVCLKCIPVHEALYNNAVKHTDEYKVKDEEE